MLFKSLKSKRQILAQGAEAIITLEGNRVLKKRVKKSYRYPKLDDKLRKSRTKKESKILQKAGKLIPVPKLIKSSLNNKSLEIEFIKGKKLSETLDFLKNSKFICEKIGENIAKLHDAGIIHGDLTTSNMIYSKHEVYFIDFGLSYESDKAEDKAVDLHLIKQAIEAKHYRNAENFFKAILKGYENSENYSSVLKRFEKVEKRGRYKQAY